MLYKVKAYECITVYYYPKNENELHYATFRGLQWKQRLDYDHDFQTAKQRITCANEEQHAIAVYDHQGWHTLKPRPSKYMNILRSIDVPLENVSYIIKQVQFESL